MILCKRESVLKVFTDVLTLQRESQRERGEGEREGGRERERGGGGERGGERAGEKGGEREYKYVESSVKMPSAETLNF